MRQHHQLNGHESEQTPGDSEGQGSLACCSSWVAKSDMIQQLNNNNYHSLCSHHLETKKAYNCALKYLWDFGENLPVTLQRASILYPGPFVLTFATQYCLELIKHLNTSGGEGNGTPPQYSCLENPMDRGAWWAAVHGVLKGQTRLRHFTFTFHFHALEKEMATHSSVLAQRIPGTGEPGGLPSMGSRRVGHN